MSLWPLQRGRIYLAKLGDLDPKWFVVVSNNQRNRNLHSVLAVRMTTTPKPPLPSIVVLDGRVPGFSGSIVCDDIVEIYPDEVIKDSGAIPAHVMRDIDDGLRAALNLL